MIRTVFKRAERERSRMMEQQKIGQLLKELRKEKGLTQAQLAEQFGVSDRSVSRWETGTTLPDLSVLVELGDHLIELSFAGTDLTDAF